MSRWLVSPGLAPVTLFGAEPFEGAWKIDLGKAVSTMSTKSD